MEIPKPIFGQLAEIILQGGAKKATKYLSEKLTVKATFQGNRRKTERTHTILFTVGLPNYEEREFIKKAKKAGEPFPVKKIQVKYPTKRK